MAYIDEINKEVTIAPIGAVTYVRLSQNENGRKLYFEILGDEIPSGSTVTLSGTKPDGLVYSTVGELSGNTVTIEEDLQMTAVAGKWDAKIRVYNEGRTIATGRIKFVIDADPVDYGSIPSDSQLDGLVAEVQMYAENVKNNAYGSPLVALTAADMIDTSKVYVYVGSETGYTNGNWYYYDNGWQSGGTYNSVAVSHAIVDLSGGTLIIS